MKDWEPFKPFVFPVGSGKGADKVLGDKALFTLGGSDGFRTRIVPLPTGGQLRVRTKNGMPEYTYEPVRTTESVEPSVSMKVIATLTAKLAGLYMTSGAYTFGALGGINQSDPMLTVEPVTYKSASVASVESSELVSLYDKTPPNSGEVSKIYNHTVNPGGLNSPKVAMWNSRPSEFSGLMRRCMQGRYGIGNTSYDMTLPEAGGGINVGSTFGRTTGILRFGTKYFFVAITSGGGGMYGFYYPLHFPEDVSGLMVGAYSEAIETLCLAYAYVDPTEEAFFGNYDIAYGEPISYGWLFSLTTNKATCVVNEMLAYGYDRRMYRRMSLSFSHDTETNEVFCSYSLDEEVDGWISPTLGPIWAPQTGETIWYNNRSISPDPLSNQDFPVHAFYAGDSLRIVRWKWSATTADQNSANLNERCITQGFETSVFGHGTTYFDQTDKYGSVTSHGFYIQGETAVPTSSSQYTRRSESATFVLNGDVASEPTSGVGFRSDCYFPLHVGISGNSFNPRIAPWSVQTYSKGASPANPRTGNHFYAYASGTVSCSHRIETDTGVSIHSSALVIPANDCSSVYIGHKESFSGSRDERDITYSAGQAWLKEWNMTLVNGKYVPSGIWWDAVFRQYSVSWKDVWQAQILTQSQGTVSFNETKPVIKMVGKEIIEVGSVDSEIFYPGLLRMMLLRQVQVLSSSIYDDKRYNKDTLSGGETAATSGYPTDISLFVGAA